MLYVCPNQSLNISPCYCIVKSSSYHKICIVLYVVCSYRKSLKKLFRNQNMLPDLLTTANENLIVITCDRSHAALRICIYLSKLSAVVTYVQGKILGSSAFDSSHSFCLSKNMQVLAEAICSGNLCAGEDFSKQCIRQQSFPMSLSMLLTRSDSACSSNLF